MSRLAINGGMPVRSKPFPAWPVHDRRELEMMSEVVASGKWGRYEGPMAERFETEFAQYQDAGHALAVLNGTIALEVALRALGVGAGDEVIVPPYTFVATATAPLMVNAVPVFVDVDPATWNIAPDKIEAAITGRTRAIIPVHFAGLPADMDRITEIARRRDLFVLEDCAHAHGASWRGRKVGALGDMGAFSFQSSKNLTCGEGGAIVSDDEKLIARAFSIHTFGRVPGRPWYEHHCLSSNYRLTEMQAALLLAGLTRLEAQTELRLANARILDEGLAKLPGLVPVGTGDPRVTRRAYHLYVFRYAREQWRDLPKERLCEAVRAEGIPLQGGYEIPVHRQPFFQNRSFGAHGCPVDCPRYGEEADYTRVEMPVADRICAEEGLWLFHGVLLGAEEDMRDVLSALTKVYENLDELR